MSQEWHVKEGRIVKVESEVLEAFGVGSESSGGFGGSGRCKDYGRYYKLTNVPITICLGQNC
jgi:hypothetical protein